MLDFGLSVLVGFVMRVIWLLCWFAFNSVVVIWHEIYVCLLLVYCGWLSVVAVVS